MAPGGYRWWYVDGLSDDGAFGIVVIGFVGSVFSPYYARALRKGAGEAENHCAINIALYGKGGHHWAMTERGRGAMMRDAGRFHVGPSSMQWQDGRLQITILERKTPFLNRIAGRIALTAQQVMDQSFALDAGGLHVWQPIAPAARIEVEMDAPRQRWSGHGYFDSNGGERPIARDFKVWDWARASTRQGAVIHYDVTRRDGTRLNLGLASNGAGLLVERAQPPLAALRGTGWRIARQARCDGGHSPRVRATLEDTPFYARSLVESRLEGEDVLLMHESLDCDRLASRWVETLLPFRMPRRAGG